MINYEGMVKEFMLRYGQTIRETPTIPDNIDEITLRFKLIREETKETLNAIDSNDLVNIADGLGDLLYVVFGTALTYGIPIDKVFAEVHRSNMTKTKLGHTKAGDKVQKGDYEPARIKEVLDAFTSGTSS